MLSRQDAGADDEPLVTAEIQECIDPVCVLADRGVHQRK